LLKNSSTTIIPTYMNRRHFILTSSCCSLLTSLSHPLFAFGDISHETAISDLRAFIQRLIYENDQVLTRYLSVQLDQPETRFHGGISNREGIYQPITAAVYLQYATSAYIESDSRYYQSPALLESINLVVGFLLRMQHNDGTIDLLSTNFHSTPDIAFVAEPVCIAYQLLKSMKDTNSLLDSIKPFLLKSGEALTVGGIHTPNHRWFVCMALARIHTLFPNPQYIDRINTWLNEKIDIDPDGQYTEKSNNIYSPLTNRCLITVARLLNRPELYEPVRRNLEMSLYYIHPNGEIATEASGRQDQYQTGTLIRYYYAYRYMALKDQNGTFARMSAYIRSLHSPDRLVRNLGYFQENPFLSETLPAETAIPSDYARSFPHSNLIRIRRGTRDATLLAQNPLFFTFSSGKAVLQGIRLASAFFGKGQFIGQSLEKAGDAYKMTYQLEGPYYQPFPVDQLPENGNWEDMPRSKRPQSEVQKIRYEVSIQEKDQGFEITIGITGTDHVPVAIEVGFRKGGILSGVTTIPEIENAYLLSEDIGTYKYEGDQIQFGPGQAPHQWTQLRGALPKLDAMSVYITGYTPFQYQLRVS